MEFIQELLGKVNLIDVLFLAFAVLGLICGFIGKAPKKIYRFVLMVACVAVAYFTCGMATEFVKSFDIGTPLGGMLSIEAGTTAGTFISDKISGLLSGFGISPDSALSLIDGFIKMFVFWLEAIGLMIVVGIVGNLIGAIIFHKAKKRTAWKTLGLFGALKSAIIFLVLIFPVIALAPTIDGISDSLSDEPNPIVVTVEEQVTSSKLIGFTNNILGKVQIEPLTYQYNEQPCNLYKDATSVKAMLKFAKALQGGSGEGGGSPISAFAEMSSDDIRELIGSIEESPVIKSAITDALSTITAELPIEIDVDNLDFGDEAELIVAVVEMVTFDDEGNVAGINPENVEPEQLVDALSNSNLVETFVQTGMLSEGMFEGADSELVDSVTQGLGEKLSDGTIDQAKYDMLISLFGSSN